MDRRLLTVREAADELHRSPDFVRDLVRRGTLVSMRIRGRYYIPGWSIDEFLRPQEPGGGSTFAMEVKPKRGGRLTR